MATKKKSEYNIMFPTFIKTERKPCSIIFLTFIKTERKPCSIRKQIIGIVMVWKRDFDNVAYDCSCNTYAL